MDSPRQQYREPDLTVAAFRSCVVFEDCDSYSWNHAKIVTVDGVHALVGGHNLWSQDYLIDEPVSDLSMRLHGPAAASAARYADRLWDYVCANRDRKASISFASTTGDCPTPATLPPAVPARGGTPVLAVGRLGAGITKDFANQSELARDLMLGAARHEIRIVQQDLGFKLGRADVPSSPTARSTGWSTSCARAGATPLHRAVEFRRAGAGAAAPIRTMSPWQALAQ